MAVRITRAGVALTVGIIVVTGLIIGGLFLVKHQGEQARREEAVKIAEQNLEQQSNGEVALNEGSEGTEVAPSEEPAAPDPLPNTENDSDEAAVGELPATGPADFGAFIVIALLAFSVASYYQSRRALS